MTRQRLIINRLDADRLQRLIDAQQHDDELSLRLESRLVQAEIVPPDDFPEDRVSMRSRLRLKGSRSGDSELTLHYPTPEDGECMSLRSHLPQPEEQETSLALCIMSPLGIALLGMAVGEQITLPREDGQSDVIRLEAILRQPEACGQFHL
ncbi:nucleoside diphosphate kinase regulator [Halomonas sp. SF2003]|nr:nucleoside diphosphate kinase regulator [Halomonas sp. SF2003]